MYCVAADCNAHLGHCSIHCRKLRVRINESKSERASEERGQSPDCGAALGLTGEARIRRRDISKLLMYSNIFETNTYHIAQYAESAWNSGEEKRKPIIDKSTLTDSCRLLLPATCASFAPLVNWPSRIRSLHHPTLHNGDNSTRPTEPRNRPRLSYTKMPMSAGSQCRRHSACGRRWPPAPLSRNHKEDSRRRQRE